MNLKQEQVATNEEAVVLRTIALSAARPGCRFLEIGSWCGDSTIILGKVAQENGGRLFCVDWWKGNVGTDLEEIAAKEDVFSYFWRRICNEGIGDVIIPIRSRSDEVARFFRASSFDLVFIDGDHRYESVFMDIKDYLPLIKKNGIICGHDCEGRIGDYEESFLERGKNVDYYETVHCGVVLAVGSMIKDYSINHAVWSVRLNEKGCERTDLVFPGIIDRRQSTPPLIGHTRNYQIQRYGRLVYGVPRSMGHFEIRDEETRNHSEIVKAANLEQLLELIGEPLSPDDLPLLLKDYRGFNLIRYNHQIFALAQALGPLDVNTIDAGTLKTYQGRNQAVLANSLEDAKRSVDLLISQTSIFVKSVKWGKQKLKQLF
jgi:predicted O-methyltransferase YrrM